MEFDTDSSMAGLVGPSCLVLHTRPGSAPQEPQLQRQLQQYRRDHQELSKQYQAKDAKCDDLRRKLRDAKAALAARTREVELAQKLIHKAGEDRAALQESAARDRVALRKLEMKVAELQDSVVGADKHNAVKKQAKELQSRLICCEAELAGRAEVEAAQQREIDKLQRALEIHARDLSREVGQDVAATLLVKVAESHTASLELAKQLAAEKDAQARLGAAAARMQQRLEAAELMRADAEAAAGQLAGRLEAVVGAHKEGTAERLALQQALADLQGRLAGLQGERDELGDALLEARDDGAAAAAAAQARIRELKGALEAAQAEVRSAATQAASESAQEAQRAGERAARLEARLAEAGEEVALLRGQLDKALAVQAAAAHSKNGHVAVLEAQVVSGKERERGLQAQLAAAHAAAASLQAQLEAATAGLGQQEQLLRKISRQDTDLLALRAERDALHRQVAGLMDALSADRDEAEAALSALRQQLAAKESALRLASESASELGEQLEGQRRLASQLSRSKAKLQASLLQQISSVKVKLQQAEQQMPDTAPLADGWLWAASPVKKQQGVGQRKGGAGKGAQAAASKPFLLPGPTSYSSRAAGGVQRTMSPGRGTGAPGVGWRGGDAFGPPTHHLAQPAGQWVGASAAIAAASRGAVESGLEGPRRPPQPHPQQQHQQQQQQLTTTLNQWLPPSKQLEMQLAGLRRSGHTRQHSVTTLQMGPGAAAAAAAEAAAVMDAFETQDTYPAPRSLTPSPDYMQGQLLHGSGLQHLLQQQQQQQQQGRGPQGRGRAEVAWADAGSPLSADMQGGGVGSSSIRAKEGAMQRGGTFSRTSSINSRGGGMGRADSSRRLEFEFSNRHDGDGDSSDSGSEERRPSGGRGAGAASSSGRGVGPVVGGARDQLLSPVSPSLARPQQQQQQRNLNQPLGGAGPRSAGAPQAAAGGMSARGGGGGGDLTDPYSLPASGDPSSSSLSGADPPPAHHAAAARPLAGAAGSMRSNAAGQSQSPPPASPANAKLAAAKEALQKLRSAKSSLSVGASSTGPSPRQMAGGEKEPPASSAPAGAGQLPGSRFAEQKAGAGAAAAAAAPTGVALAAASRAASTRAASPAVSLGSAARRRPAAGGSSSEGSEDDSTSSGPSPAVRGTRVAPPGAGLHQEPSSASSVGGLRSGASSSSLGTRLQQLQARQQELRQRTAGAAGKPQAQVGMPERPQGAQRSGQAGVAAGQQQLHLLSPPSTGKPLPGGRVVGRGGVTGPVPFQGFEGPAGGRSGRRGSSSSSSEEVGRPRSGGPPMDRLLAALAEGEPTLEQLANLEDLLG